jgi:polyhydroxybutyrate depolymerase
MAEIIKKALLVLAVLVLVLGVLAVVSLPIVNETSGTLQVGDQVREYLLYVPESDNSAAPSPLVISLHGFAEWPAHLKWVSGWNELADEADFIVLYPSGTRFPKRWHVSGFGSTSAETQADVAFIAELIEVIASEHNIDRSRIYVSGFSNGGGMAHVLVCELSEQIAAVGAVAGAYGYPWEECRQYRPVPFIAFHGTADLIVPYDGSEMPADNHALPAVPEWIGVFADRNGCEPDPLPLPITGEVAGVQYTHCDQNAQVHFYTIMGGGHSWPGGDSLPRFIVGHTTSDISTTEVMWDFFKGYSLPDK